MLIFRAYRSDACAWLPIATVVFRLLEFPRNSCWHLACKRRFLFTASYFDAATTGQIALAITAFALPFALIGRATSRAYFGEMSKLGAHNVGEIFVSMRQVMLASGLMALPVSVLLFFYAEPIVAFALGAGGRRPGVLSRSLP